MWGATPFLITFPFDSDFGVRVEFFPHSLPKAPLLSVQVSPSVGEICPVLRQDEIVMMAVHHRE